MQSPHRPHKKAGNELLIPHLTLGKHVLVKEPVGQHGKVPEVDNRIIVQVDPLRSLEKSYVVKVGLSVIVGSDVTETEQSNLQGLSQQARDTQANLHRS